MTVIHKSHPEACQGCAKAHDWDPDRVAKLGMKECDMKEREWKVEIDESAFKRLEFTEVRKDASGSLLLSVKIAVVADRLPLALRPRDVWIRTHLDNRYVWRNVATNEWFWEDSPGVWKRYTYLGICWWGTTNEDGSTGRYFFERTGTPEWPDGLEDA